MHAESLLVPGLTILRHRIDKNHVVAGRVRLGEFGLTFLHLVLAYAKDRSGTERQVFGAPELVRPEDHFCVHWLKREFCAFCAKFSEANSGGKVQQLLLDGRRWQRSGLLLELGKVFVFEQNDLTISMLGIYLFSYEVAVKQLFHGLANFLRRWSVHYLRL